VQAWSGRWVESPFSLAATAANVVRFAAMTAVMADRLLTSGQRRHAVLWLRRERVSIPKPRD